MSSPSCSASSWSSSITASIGLSFHGYLTALSRPELVVHFFRDTVGVAEVSKEALSQRTNDYQRWVEAYARNHST